MTVSEQEAAPELPDRWSPKVEAAWAYRHRPDLTSAVLRLRQQTQSLPVVAIATRAQRRLCTRYRASAMVPKKEYSKPVSDE